MKPMSQLVRIVGAACIVRKLVNILKLTNRYRMLVASQSFENDFHRVRVRRAGDKHHEVPLEVRCPEKEEIQ